MKIFIDNEFKCHVDDDGTRRTVETLFFNGKCAEFIEGYRFVPQGETWVDGGTEYCGEMICPWKPYETLIEIQNAVDRTQNEADTELAALIEQIYLEDLEEIYNV